MLDESTLSETQSVPINRLAQKRDTLARALGVVRAMETSVLRTAVFEEIKAKNRIIRLADRVYAAGNAYFLRRPMLALYTLKTVAAIDRVTRHLPDVEIANTRILRANLMTRSQALALYETLGLIGSRWRFLGHLAKSEDFLPACRIVSALAADARFHDMLVQAPGLRATIAASNYSPGALGLAAAADKVKRFVVYVKHAPVPRNSP